MQLNVRIQLWYAMDVYGMDFITIVNTYRPTIDKSSLLTGEYVVWK